MYDLTFLNLQMKEIGESVCQSSAGLRECAVFCAVRGMCGVAANGLVIRKLQLLRRLSQRNAFSQWPIG
jgi:hypothetical protein